MHKAIGRLLFTYDYQSGYVCSGTLVQGNNDRVIIATAAHCAFDESTKTFPQYVMFVPGQDDGETDASNWSCVDDPYGCFYPTFAVIPRNYYSASNFQQGIPYDYAFFVAADSDAGPNNMPVTSSGTATSLQPMGISFNGINLNQETYLFGYPADQDNYSTGAKLMYTRDMAQSAYRHTGSYGYYLPCSGLSGGASGGPWTQSDPVTGYMTLQSVNSWGWAQDGLNGMGSPPYTSGAQCVFNAANSRPLNSGDYVAYC